MSGGVLELHGEYKFEETVKQIEDFIERRDNSDYPLKQETKDKLREGINMINMAKIFVNRIDYLMADDDGEDEFLKQIKIDLNSEYFYE